MPNSPPVAAAECSDVPSVATLAQRAGIPALGWLPELVVLLVLLSVTGMLLGAISVQQAVAALAGGAIATGVGFVRLPYALRVEQAAAPEVISFSEERQRRRMAG